ncbi:DUF1896 family protein [Chryseobacterium defluvii]|uniref:Uncharacterized protein DUF1896 n=1 Tax=Chryseobacterium defluvii TaxID=160396 RepID=A0A495SN59_9FLAO|nr:DUF1896 family protein [Chryseobacterium defluvii]RKT01749.1 uncharacterized protein DUF1896 [Chryseobacterium defluvii]
MDHREEINSYQTKLAEHLKISFPELKTDFNFIRSKATLAVFTKKNALLSGNDEETSNQIAERILFEGFYFSKFETVCEVLKQEFSELMLDEEYTTFALKMVKNLNCIFDNYDLTDDFIYTYDYDNLYIDIKEFIKRWIEENGL